MSARPTLKQLAERLQVSETTVSLILHDKGRFSESTRRRVLDEAVAFGYRPNQAAQAMAKGRFGSLALLMSAEGGNSRLFNGLLDGIEDALDERKLHLLVARLADADLVDRANMPKLLTTVASDGLLINYHVRIPDSMERLIAEFRLPSVWMNTKRAVNAVYPDDHANARTATEALLRLGHRRIAYVNLNRAPHLDEVEHYSFIDRRDGYLAAMAEAGCRPILLGPEGGEEMPNHERIDRVKAWLTGPERPTAFLTYSEYAAFPLFTAAHALGLSIPRDCSLVTFNDTVVRTFGPQLGTMIIPFREVGSSAVALVHQRIGEDSRDLPAIAVTGTLVAGDTVAAAPSA